MSVDMSWWDEQPASRTVVVGAHIQCLVCGNWYKALSTHVIRTHGFASADDYRQALGLSQRGLVGDETREKLRRHATDMGLSELGKQTRVTKPPPKPVLSPEGRAVANDNLRRGNREGLKKVWEERRSATHCKRGHEFTPENTYVWKRDGTRKCRTCNREWKAHHRKVEAR